MENLAEARGKRQILRRRAIRSCLTGDEKTLVPWGTGSLAMVALDLGGPRF